MTQKTLPRNGSQPDDNRLDSWKEIAAYLRRDERTVRRWEKSENLPVHRHQHKIRSSVYAYPSELDAWRANRVPETASAPIRRRLPWRALPAFASAMALALMLLMAGSGPNAVPVMAADAPEIVVRRVWSGLSVDTLGAPSPDGRYLSFVDWETSDLAIRDLQSGENRRLTNNETALENLDFAYTSRWMPDSKQVLYEWYSSEPDSPYSFSYELRVVGLDGSEPHTVYRLDESLLDQLEDGAICDLSPDGEQALGVRRMKNGPVEIGLLNIADGELRTIRELGRSDVGIARFSPEGTYVAFDYPSDEDSAERDIFLLSLESGSMTPLFEHPAHDTLLGWSPEGDWILFASDRSGSTDWYAMRIADGKAQGDPRLIKRDARGIVPLGFTQDGSFYYGRTEIVNDIYAAELDPQTGEVLAPPVKLIQRFEGRNRGPSYSHGGEEVAYFSDRGPMIQGRYRSRVLCVQSLDSGSVREFPLELSDAYDLRWSPDGHSFLLGGRDGQGRRGIYWLDTQTGALASIVSESPEITIHPHEISRDGEAIFYVRRDRSTNVSQILRRELASGSEQELYRGTERFILSASPDGRWLAYLSWPVDISSISANRILRVVPMDGGEAREVFRFENLGLEHIPLAWSADGRYLLFPRQEAQSRWGWALWRVLASGGVAEKLGLEAVQFQKIAVHPNGQQIAYSAPSSATTREAEIWVMENFLPEPVAQTRGN